MRKRKCLLYIKHLLYPANILKNSTDNLIKERSKILKPKNTKHIDQVQLSPVELCRNSVVIGETPRC